jgi:hypothetical protein
MKINIREIFGAFRFSTFATVSAHRGPTRALAECQLFGVKRAFIRGVFPALTR